jgi:hypothetical protein
MVWPLESIAYSLLALQNLDFKELIRTTYLPRWAALSGSNFEPNSFISAAANWNVVEVVTSSWGFLWIVFAAGARIVWKIYEHLED